MQGFILSLSCYARMLFFFLIVLSIGSAIFLVMLPRKENQTLSVVSKPGTEDAKLSDEEEKIFKEITLFAESLKNISKIEIPFKNIFNRPEDEPTVLEPILPALEFIDIEIHEFLAQIFIKAKESLPQWRGTITIDDRMLNALYPHGLKVNIRTHTDTPVSRVILDAIKKTRLTVQRREEQIMIVERIKPEYTVIDIQQILYPFRYVGRIQQPDGTLTVNISNVISSKPFLSVGEVFSLKDERDVVFEIEKITKEVIKVVSNKGERLTMYLNQPVQRDLFITTIQGPTGEIFKNKKTGDTIGSGKIVDVKENYVIIEEDSQKYQYNK